ncbi:MAG TPA: DUF4105 domain-containing protein, partial [Cyclobacteriaceae bacterium]|nr:DUF4105 domain-containing protein [Cyclobacteriaceae bacterium]
MKKVVLAIVLTLGMQATAQTLTLSTSAEISIITCGPWQGELYSAFGHSAIRVYDPVNGLDDAYNYGVFDFNQPNFYLNYTRGLLLFKLGIYPYRDFRDYYAYYNRYVIEQILDLSQDQKQKIYEYLEWNARPENETYRYDYFYNNCSSVIRDVFVKNLKDSIHFDDSFVKTDYTIRQLTDLYLKQQPWGDLGIDICLGLPMDKKATPYEYMFLPDYLEYFFDHATVTRNGETVPIVKLKIPVYRPHPQAEPKSWFHPWVAFGAFLAITIGLCIYDLRRKKLSKWFDVIVFGVVGLIGILLLILWTATDHAAAAKNFNLLWALPTHVFVFLI